MPLNSKRVSLPCANTWTQVLRGRLANAMGVSTMYVEIESVPIDPVQQDVDSSNPSQPLLDPSQPSSSTPYPQSLSSSPPPSPPSSPPEERFCCNIPGYGVVTFGAAAHDYLSQLQAFLSAFRDGLSRLCAHMQCRIACLDFCKEPWVNASAKEATLKRSIFSFVSNAVGMAARMLGLDAAHEGQKRVVVATVLAPATQLIKDWQDIERALDSTSELETKLHVHILQVRVTPATKRSMRGVDCAKAEEAIEKAKKTNVPLRELHSAIEHVALAREIQKILRELEEALIDPVPYTVDLSRVTELMNDARAMGADAASAGWWDPSDEWNVKMKAVDVVGDAVTKQLQVENAPPYVATPPLCNCDQSPVPGCPLTLTPTPTPAPILWARV